MRKPSLKVSLHPLFLILGAVLLIMGEGAVFFICTFSALLHELGHGIVAEKFGYKMKKIKLMPFGAELLGDTDSFDGNDELFIAIAGPCVNLFICLIILGLWWVFPEVYSLTELIFTNNLVMACFNLLPLFPLDGGRVLLSFLNRKMNRREAVKIVKLITKIFAITLFLCFILTIFNKLNLSLGIMAFMLFFTASSSAKDAVYQKISLKELVQNRCVRWVNMSVPATKKVYELTRYHLKNQIIIFIVVDEEGRELFRFDELKLEKIRNFLPQSEEIGKIKGLLAV